MSDHPTIGAYRPIGRAYSMARMNVRCPNCGAEPEAYCIGAHGHVRRLPCLARMHCEQKATGPYQ